MLLQADHAPVISRRRYPIHSILSTNLWHLPDSGRRVV